MRMAAFKFKIISVMHATYDHWRLSVLHVEVPKLVHSSVKYCLPKSSPPATESAKETIEMKENNEKPSLDGDDEKPSLDGDDEKPSPDGDGQQQCQKRKKPSSVRLH